MDSTLNEMKLLISMLERDVTSLKAGKKTCATSSRKHAQCISKECTKIRTEILNFQKGLPTKSRAKKGAVEPLDINREVEAAVASIVPAMADVDINIDNEPPPPPLKLVRQNAEQGHRVPHALRAEPKKRARKSKVVGA